MEKFKWPKEQKLKLKLKDLLEDKVDEKYYLSGEKIKSIQNWNAQQDPIENMKKMDKTGLCSTLNTRDGDDNAGMKLIQEKIKKEKLFSSFAQENIVSSKNDETIPTLTSTGAFSGHKIIENVFESKHHGGKVHDPNGIAPTFKENHGNGLFINEQGVKLKLNGKKNGQIGTLENTKWKFEQPNRVYDGYFPTLRAGENEQKVIQQIETQIKIRKITPREALRLMGLDDKRIDLIQDSNLVTHNKQYFVAGNSIVVQVLEAIFKQIDFGDDIERVKND